MVLANAERRDTEAVGSTGGDGVNQIDSAVAVEDNRLTRAGVDRRDEDRSFRPSVTGKPGSDDGTPPLLSGSVGGASISSAAAPILRRMSAASLAAAMIRFVLSIWSMTGAMGGRPPLGRPGSPCCGDGPSRIARSSSGGEALVTWAVAVAPADVPIIRSASVTSTPALNRPAMTPISHAFPADPPP